MVIVSNQETPYDNESMKILGNCDEVMKEVMKKLNIDIGVYEYKQTFCVENIGNRLIVKGGKTNEPCTCIEEVYIMKDKKTRLEGNRGQWEFSGGDDGSEIDLLFEFKPEFQVDEMKLKFQPKMPNSQQFVDFVKTVQYN